MLLKFNCTKICADMTEIKFLNSKKKGVLPKANCCATNQFYHPLNTEHKFHSIKKI